jgi:hypothetical protein
MKRLFMILEDLWVAAAFAEEDAYDELLNINKPRLQYRDIALLRSARSS